MNSKLIFIYDGECPFCNKFAELLELKSSLPNLKVKNAREHIEEMKSFYEKGFDIDNGAILIKDGEILHGASAINWICSQVKNPSDSLLKFITYTFSSNYRTNFLFPFLLISRRFTLLAKKVPRKLNFN